MIQDNTATRIILGIALVAIWGLVIYKIVDAMKDKDTPNIAPITYWQDSTNTTVNKNYQLHLGYNDPFLKTINFVSNYSNDSDFDNGFETTEIQQNLSTPPATIANLLPQKPKKVQFPSMEYLGFVINKQNGQSLAIMKHDKKTYRVRQGDKIANCYVLSIQRDSIEVSLKGQIKTVKR